MNNIGKTPLIRAVNLEKALGVEKIYLKLEGNNPTHSHYDRAAKAIVRTAEAMDKNVIIIDGEKRLLRSIKLLGQKHNIKVLVPIQKRENWKNKIIDKENLIDLSGVKKKDVLELLKNLEKRNNAFLISEEDKLRFLDIAYENIAEEILDRYPDDIDSLHLEDDHEIAYNAFLKIFLKNNLENNMKLPEIYRSSPEKGALNSGDNIIKISKSLLEEAHMLLQKHEHIKLKTKDVYPFAAFLLRIKANQIKDGRHIILLNTARSKVDIRQITDFSEIEKHDLVKYVENYLDRYSDSKAETLEAIELAMKDGYILMAKRGDLIAGVSVIVNLNIERFIPKYHLAYIGINPLAKGRGIGSELIKEAINLTNGNLSLHVDLDNKNAKKLYKKMGFEHVYDRMIYQK
ncbi:MAG: pyridoxal-phosphate dependent enzyme [Candidatus Izemoplasmatales bacterium]|jgi:threonine synthase|nr:pyridoxal-phosphate dependent enzyme [Candidatus Izemoplasmatales bacterium]